MKFCNECGRELDENEVCNCLENINNNQEELLKGVYDGEFKFGLMSNDELNKLYSAIKDKELSNKDSRNNIN